MTQKSFISLVPDVYGGHGSRGGAGSVHEEQVGSRNLNFLSGDSQFREDAWRQWRHGRLQLGNV